MTTCTSHTQKADLTSMKTLQLFLKRAVAVCCSRAASSTKCVQMANRPARRDLPKLADASLIAPFHLPSPLRACVPAPSCDCLLADRSPCVPVASLNDPGTNTAFYQESCRAGDDPRASPSQRPAAEPRVAVFDDEAPVPLGIDDQSSEASATDWLRFSEKDPLSRPKEATKERATSRENVRGVHGPATVELATQLGLPASATYDEVGRIVCMFTGRDRSTTFQTQNQCVEARFAWRHRVRTSG